jgi:hypothetical protein
MTDDFRLFTDEADIDPDVAVISAYLAGELTLVQVTAVEERLVNDSAFRGKVQPVIDAWVQPVSFAPGLTRLPPARATNDLLSRAEVDAGWDRYMRTREAVPAGPRIVPTHETAPSNLRRTRTMTRIAAMIAAVALPVIGVAQAAVYAARHDTAPGHRIARAVVAPFLAQPSAPQPVPSGPVATPEDIRIGKALKPQRAESAGIPPASRPESPSSVLPPIASTRAAPSAPSFSVATPSLPAPDRKAIAALAERLQPDVVSGRILAGYIVILLDHNGNALWSTRGIGSVMLDVAGDTRSDADRAEFSRIYAKEFGTASFDRSLVDDYVVVSEQRSLEGLRLKDIPAVRDSSGKPRYAKANVPGNTAIEPPPAGYRTGFAIVVNRGKISANSAEGLEIPRDGGSGIVGRPATSIARVDAYYFPKKEISPQLLQVYAVYLK